VKPHTAEVNNDAPRRAGTSHAGKQVFPETRWSLVLRAQGGSALGSKEALAELCECYWFPLYSWLRRRGDSPEDAADTVQSWFVNILGRNDIESLAREKGKLRTFFLTSLKNFSIKESDKAKALKRGGAAPHISIDRRDAEDRYGYEPPDDSGLTPDRLYERAWATLLLERVFSELKSEYKSRGKEAVYETLKSHIAWNSADRPLKDAADILGMKEGTVRVAVVRLRKRFKRILEKEILQTINDSEDVQDEIDFLRQVFSL